MQKKEIMAKERFYHIYTKGLEDMVIFLDREDYIAGMNYIAICVHLTSIDLLAFVLMSNHFHFVTKSGYDDAVRFINLFKQLIASYLRNKYGTVKALHQCIAECKEIDLTDEGLKKIIAYILNNPVKAGINCAPQNYEWSSCRCYFSNIGTSKHLTPISSLGTRKARSILHSKCQLNDSYLINEDGYIEPASYVNIQFVEKLFKRASSLGYFLNSSSRTDRKEMPVSYSDSTIISCLKEILEKQYDSLSISELPEESVIRIIRYLKNKLACSPKQIARILNLEVKRVIQVINI